MVIIGYNQKRLLNIILFILIQFTNKYPHKLLKVLNKLKNMMLH